MIKKILAILIIGLFLFGFFYPVSAQEQMIFYPDPDPETSSVDGQAHRYYDAGESFSIIRAGVGTDAFPSGAGMEIKVRTNTATDKFDRLSRGFILFDTSALPDNAVITNAVLSVAGDNKNNYFVEPVSIALVSSNPNSNTNLIAGDYQTIGSVRFSDDIAFDDILIGSYNDFVLNSSGISAIDKEGISKFGLRSDWDLDNTPPAWVSATEMNIIMKTAESGTKPKLVVDYTIPAGIFNLPAGFISGTMAYIGDLFTDTSPLILIAIGLPLGFWVIFKVIMMTIPQGDERRKKSKEFHRVGEQLEKQNKRENRTWERKLKNEERRELKRLKKIQKGDWF